MLPMQSDESSRVIGVYAYSGPGSVFLYEDGCVVAGSEELIKQYLKALAEGPATSIKVSKIRFGELYAGLKSGAVYAFDRQSYGRFYALARRAGIDDLHGFPDASTDDIQLMKVRFDPK